MSGRPNKTVLQDTIKEENQKNHFQTFYNDSSLRDSMSPADKASMKTQEIFTTLAKPLKRIQQKFLNEVADTCYPDKWMAPDFTNDQQIILCKDKVHRKYFGGFMDLLENTRNSNQFRFQDCLMTAENDIVASMNCIQNYVNQVDKDNSYIAEQMQAMEQYQQFF